MARMSYAADPCPACRHKPAATAVRAPAGACVLVRVCSMQFKQIVWLQVYDGQLCGDRTRTGWLHKGSTRHCLWQLAWR